MAVRVRDQAALMLSILLAAAPAGALAQTEAAAQAEAVVVELVFGLSSADGGGVSGQAWEAYLTDVLSRNVPGFTVTDCRGGWREDGELKREDCKHVLVLTDRAGIPPLRAAVDAYKQRFRQDSVLWLQRPCEEGCGFR